VHECTPLALGRLAHYAQIPNMEEVTVGRCKLGFSV